jgi:hypothetical protein
VARPGTYDVTLLLSENRPARKGLRRFSVQAEGVTALRDVDIFARASRNTAHRVTVPVHVRDGRLDLSFAASVGEAEVSAIQIAPSSTVLTAGKARTTAATTASTPSTDGVQRISTRTSSYTDRSGKVWSARARLHRRIPGGRLCGGDHRHRRRPAVPLRALGHDGFSTAVPAAGTYNVTLKFAENYYSGADLRSFGVTAEGRSVVSALDIFARVGKDAAYDVTVPVSVTDGTLNLGFAATRDNAKLSAVSIAPATATAAPAPRLPRTGSRTRPGPGPRTRTGHRLGQRLRSALEVRRLGHRRRRRELRDLARPGSGHRRHVVRQHSRLHRALAAAVLRRVLPRRLAEGHRPRRGRTRPGRDLGAGGAGRVRRSLAPVAQQAQDVLGLPSRHGLPALRPRDERQLVRLVGQQRQRHGVHVLLASLPGAAAGDLPASKLVFSVNRESVGNGIDWRKTFPARRTSTS